MRYFICANDDELSVSVVSKIRYFISCNGNGDFIYDEKRKTLVGERTNRIFKIGDKVKIRVIEANKALRKISFELVEEDEIIVSKADDNVQTDEEFWNEVKGKNN